MNKSEYYNGNDKYNYYYKHVQKLLKDWKTENNIIERCVVHHRDDTEECIKYNNEHYELWGFEIDKNGNLKFEEGKYVQFMTHQDHARYHNTGEKNHFYGKHLSNEHKNKISTAMKGNNSPWYGKVLSAEHRHKLSISHIGKVLSDEQKKKISDTLKGRITSQETKAKMSQNNARYWKGKHHSEETKEKIRAAQKGKKLSDEAYAKVSAARQCAKFLYNLYKNNGGILKWNDFNKALKNGDITFEMQPITIFTE